MVLWVPSKNPFNIVQGFIRQARTSNMRILLNKRSSTKAERRFHEVLKKLHIPFKAKVKIGGREVDFVIGKYAIDIDGHEQDINKNIMLITRGYNPIHFDNRPNPYLDEWITKIQCHLQQLE